MPRCRIGLIGAGNVAQRHARVLTGLADVELAGVTDVRPEAAAELAAQVGSRAFPGAPELLAADLDAVYVCVPPFAHGQLEETVVGRGLPMFVEKPLAADLATAERIAGLVAQRGLLTAVGHHWRYLQVVERAREILGGRPVRLVVGSWLDKVPPVAWWPVRERSGGPVVEQAAHVVDLARWLAGEVTQVYAQGDGRPPPADGADIDAVTTATLRFAGGALGTLSTACVLGRKHRAGLEVYADGLALEVGEEGLVVHDERAGKTPERVQGDPEAARLAVDRAFVDAVLGRADDVRASYAEALGTHRVTCAVAASAASGDPVPVEAALPVGATDG